jgi:hypothetical protein
MRSRAGLAGLLLVLVCVSPVAAQTAPGFGLKSINPVGDLPTPGVVSNPGGGGSLFNPLGIFKGFNLGLLRWPPKSGASTLPNGIITGPNPFPTAIFPFPTSPPFPTSASLPTMKVQTSFQQ